MNFKISTDKEEKLLFVHFQKWIKKILTGVAKELDKKKKNLGLKEKQKFRVFTEEKTHVQRAEGEIYLRNNNTFIDDTVISMNFIFDEVIRSSEKADFKYMTKLFYLETLPDDKTIIKSLVEFITPEHLKNVTKKHVKKRRV